MSRMTYAAARALLLTLVAVHLFTSATYSVTNVEKQPENLALKSKISVSSTRDPYAKELAIDGKPDTAWSTALGATTGQWLQLDWDEPQQISGVVLRQTGLFVNAVNVQIERNGNWITVGTVGFANQKPPCRHLKRSDPAACES